MEVTQAFLDACKGKSLDAAGYLKDTDGNWWVGRVNTFALVGFEAATMTEAAAQILTDPSSTLSGGGVLYNGIVYTFAFDSKGMLDKV